MRLAESIQKKPTPLICFGLAIITLLVYLPILRHSFINYDDPDYIVGNAHVNHGVTWSGIAWAFESAENANWHPLTWISHMIDCQLFGLQPAGHHLVNVLFHIADTLLLFLLLRNLTGTVWRSAFVAAAFAWHPLHVESVAWASERKDVLSAFFWMLTLLAYARFVKESAAHSPRLKWFYFLALLMFACGLMSKPMVVTLPCVLFLLDFWPLNRIWGPGSGVSGQNIFKLLLEKIPFFALTLASCVITMHVQSGARWSAASLPLPYRLENAAMSYVRYISKIFYPTDLALIYPYPHSMPLWAVIAVVIVLGLLSVAFILQAKRFPYLIVGWLWFLGTLVPTIGIIQVGVQSMADRYSYLPSIGIFIIAAWGLNDLLGSRTETKKILPVLAVLALAAYLALTELQLSYWRNSLTVFLHTVEVTTDNYAADDCLGKTLENIGKTEAAAQYYSMAVQLEPDYPMAQFDLGMLDVETGKDADASNHLAVAANLAPQNSVMQFDFGVYLAQHGSSAEAASRFKTALADRPDFPEAQQQLDLILKTK